MDLPSNRIKMKVLGPAGTGVGMLGILAGRNGSDNTEEAEQLLDDRTRLRNPWNFALRILLILLLVASFLSIMLLIGKEWYFLSHQARIKSPILNSLHDDVCAIQSEYRFDCIPANSATKDECLRRGCCWDTAVRQQGQPWCFFSRRFSYYSWGQPFPTKYGVSSKLVLNANMVVPYPDSVKELVVKVYFETQDTVRIVILDTKTTRYEIPFNYTKTTEKSAKTDYTVELGENGIRIFRKGFTFPLFDTTVAPLIYTNQFLQISSLLPSEYVYGIGEVEDKFKRSVNWTRSVLWTHDTVPKENTNLYSSHPFYFVLEKEKGTAHGVFLANSNAMEVILQPAPAVTFRTIGGILDFRIYTGPRPSDVMNQYTKTIGRPFLPPYWSLGFHLCRFNYGTLNHTREILENNLAAGIPVDVQWNDLDYMQNQNDFTFDKVKFKGLPEFVKWLHQQGMHYIPIVDPGVSGGEIPGTYMPYELGIEKNVFIKDGQANAPFIGKVWNPNSTVWPDFSHPNASSYWLSVFDNFHNQVEIDGVWIDMNEPSNFWDGTQNGLCDSKSNLDYPTYVPHVEGEKLHYKTVCPSARQYGGRHYDLHNLYGTMETIITSRVLGDIRSRRQFIISRSTFPGHGHYGGHWTGDVNSNWDHLRKTIPQILNFGLYGIPMVGADICGFNGNTTAELCKRWQQLGAFYPFARNHNTDDGIPQDPASLGPEVVAASKETLTLRYSLLPYLYSLFFHSHVTGEPVARALLYEFPTDTSTYQLETTFMLGPAVLVVPILQEGYDDPSIITYLPKGWWYPHYESEIIESLGEEKEINIPLYGIPVIYREGTILMRQEPALNTVNSRKNPLTLHAFLTPSGIATGEFYWDDGDTPNPDILGGFSYYKLTVAGRNLSIAAMRQGYSGTSELTLGSIELRGILSSVSAVTINNVPCDTFTFDITARRLFVDLTQQKLTFTDGLSLVWTY